MEYAAEIFIEENGNRDFRLYAGQPEKQFVSFCYGVGDLFCAAINIANDKDAYRVEREFRLKKLSESSVIEIDPGVIIPDWSNSDCAFINFAALTASIEKLPKEQLLVFGSGVSFFAVLDDGIDVHYSFNTKMKETHLSFKSLFDALLYDGYEAMKYKVEPTRCQNCGKLFFPHSRSDEIYCNHIFRNGKTCKELGYEMKVAADQIMKEYRRIYKMQNARKQRNQQKRDIASSFDNWAAFAKQKLKACQNGEITLDEMKQQISGADWMP